ncbi:hypothetical protein CSAL01_07076 [Colletotrichum salicis]|uniref:Uncharacterized protein n=1 Tax=Colletotrichum salicis TaxID=1209931 RepID=A0A135UBE4_9PEZI|nr:hypothetical protein CSAL01_07076 [Colletotrichum salicis]
MQPRPKSTETDAKKGRIREKEKAENWGKHVQVNSDVSMTAGGEARAQSFIESLLQPPMTKGQSFPVMYVILYNWGNATQRCPPNAERWGKRPRRWRREDRRLEGPAPSLSAGPVGMSVTVQHDPVDGPPKSPPDLQVGAKLRLAWGIVEDAQQRGQ